MPNYRRVHARERTHLYPSHAVVSFFLARVVLELQKLCDFHPKTPYWGPIHALHWAKPRKLTTSIVRFIKAHRRHIRNKIVWENFHDCSIFACHGSKHTWHICKAVWFFFLCFSSGSESKINAGGWKEKKNRKKKNSITSHGSPCTQQNLDTQLATAKLLLVIHSTRNSAAVKTFHSDCLTVKRDPLRKHVQPQIYYDHGPLIECMETYSVDQHDQLFVFFLHDFSKSMRTIDEKQRKKRHGLSKRSVRYYPGQKIETATHAKLTQVKQRQ